MRASYAMIAALAAWIAGCSIGRPMPAATTYGIEPPPATEQTSAPLHAERLQLGRVRVAAPYDRTPLVYRLSAVRYVSDPYHAFIADPGPMLANRIVEWLNQTGRYRAVVGPGGFSPPSQVLDVAVTELYGDFQESTQAAAVMSIEFTLIDQSSPRPKIAYERSITRRIPLSSSSPEALVRGYGSALAEILSQLTADLAGNVGQ